MGNIIPNQNSIFKSPAVVMAFQNIHRPWRGCLWAAQSLALCLQSKRPLLCHPGSAQLASIYAKKRRKIIFISAIPERGMHYMKQYCLVSQFAIPIWQDSQVCQKAFNFSNTATGDFLFCARIPPNDRPLMFMSLSLSPLQRPVNPLFAKSKVMGTSSWDPRYPAFYWPKWKKGLRQ